MTARLTEAEVGYLLARAEGLDEWEEWNEQLWFEDDPTGIYHRGSFVTSWLQFRNRCMHEEEDSDGTAYPA